MDDAFITETLAKISAAVSAIPKLMERVEKLTTDLSEFSERFEEVMERVENERRLDLPDYN